jgi:hypothetical protein
MTRGRAYFLVLESDGLRVDTYSIYSLARIGSNRLKVDVTGAAAWGDPSMTVARGRLVFRTPGHLYTVPLPRF